MNNKQIGAIQLVGGIILIGGILNSNTPSYSNEMQASGGELASLIFWITAITLIVKGIKKIVSKKEFNEALPVERKDILIALEHWLISWVLLSTVASLLINLALAKFIYGLNPISLSLIVGISNTIAILLCIMYSAKYINKKYIINNVRRVINISLIFIIVTGIGFRLYLFSNGSEAVSVWIGTAFFIVNIAVFNFISKKYLHNTVIDTSSESNIKSK